MPGKADLTGTENETEALPPRTPLALLAGHGPLQICDLTVQLLHLPRARGNSRDFALWK